ncbi:caspase-3-like [Antennarius striatus]|uniref:caspase-3-like n=1 Tax=Antennarius striatus TaxID=241820 RepID=UPI0035AEBE70
METCCGSQTGSSPSCDAGVSAAPDSPASRSGMGGAKAAVRRNKVAILSSVCRDPGGVLDRSVACGVITRGEHRRLSSTGGGDVRGRVIELLDCILMKGEGSCHAFLWLLQADGFFTPPHGPAPLPPPGTSQVTCGHGCVSYCVISEQTCACVGVESCVALISSDTPSYDRKRRKQDDAYLLNSHPTGLFLILNNENFLTQPQRGGTQQDVDSLAVAYSRLGFRVLLCQDQTRDQMTRVLNFFATLGDLSELQELRLQEWSGTKFAALQGPPSHGDAFFCSVLSHGAQGGVYGVDGQLLSVKDMLGTFRATPCSPLRGKPKCFLIQACRGKLLQRGTPQHLQMDGCEPLTLPQEADFLVVFATVDGYASIRSVRHGSWFIQSLCRQLEDGCLKGEDMLSILLRVNDDVSQKEACLQPGGGKQMPEVRFTLRKSLVLKPNHT